MVGYPLEKGGDALNAYEVLMVLFTFGLFMIATLSFVVKLVSEFLKNNKK
ncbi:putative holin-like toxin [Pontibacillus sp. HMF3514]